MKTLKTLKTLTYLCMLIVCSLVSCSQNDNLFNGVQSSTSVLKTRGTNCDLREIGEVHNLMLDCGQEYLSQNNCLTPTDQDSFIPKALKVKLISLLESTLPVWVVEDIDPTDRTLSIQKYIETYSNYYGMINNEMYADSVTPVDNDDIVVFPIDDMIDETLWDNSIYHVNPSLNLSNSEREFVERIANITIDDNGNPVSNATLKDRIDELKVDWELTYGEDGYINFDSQNIVSGICLCITLSSYEWWHNWFSSSTNGKNKRRIAPIIAYFIQKDARGALKGIIISLAAGNRDPRSIARHGVISGGISSLCGLF